jgi:predicted RNA-binding protein associated with RNAse of E/G family
MAGVDVIAPQNLGGSPFSFEFIRPPDRHSTFESTLIEATDQHIILTHRITPSAPLQYNGEFVMEDGYRAVWFLFKEQPYDIARMYRPDGTWTGYYVDVLEPVHWDGNDPHSLQPLVDLFLDLWIAPDGSFRVLDEDELQAAIERGVITQQQAGQARETLADVVARARRGDFPPPLAQDFRP